VTTFLFLCQAVCQGCRAPVNVWRLGDRVVIRDRSMVESPVHLCPPELRERIEIPFMELMAFECWRCGEKDVAPTSWGRVVDFPSSDPETEGWAEAWVGPLDEHVCRRPSAPNKAATSPRPVWEAFGT
jgi:hypothetical protein